MATGGHSRHFDVAGRELQRWLAAYGTFSSQQPRYGPRRAGLRRGLDICAEVWTWPQHGLGNRALTREHRNAAPGPKGPLGGEPTGSTRCEQSPLGGYSG